MPHFLQKLKLFHSITCFLFRKLKLFLSITLCLLHKLKLFLYTTICIHNSCSPLWYAQIFILGHLSLMGCKFNIFEFSRFLLSLLFFLTLYTKRSLTKNLDVVFHSAITNLRCMFIGWNIFARPFPRIYWRHMLLPFLVCILINTIPVMLYCEVELIRPFVENFDPLNL